MMLSFQHTMGTEEIFQFVLASLGRSYRQCEYLYWYCFLFFSSCLCSFGGLMPPFPQRQLEKKFVLSLSIFRKNYWARRSPRLKSRKSGVLKYRSETRQFLALRLQPPPRNTRREPEEGPCGLFWEELL